MAANRGRRYRALVLADPIDPTEQGEKREVPAPELIRHRQGGFGRLEDTRREAFGIVDGFHPGGATDDWRLEVEGKTIGPAELEHVLASARNESIDSRSMKLSTPMVDLWLGSTATRHALLAASLERYRFIHLACHGHVDERNPGLCALMLSPAPDDSGVLKLVDALNLRLDAELVTLSGCRTGRGRARRGDGLEGLVRAFLFAGADNVIASAFRVPDSETASLLPRTYESLLGPKHDPAGALRSAKLRYLESVPDSDAEKAHPYYWGAWMLWGVGVRPSR